MNRFLLLIFLTSWSSVVPLSRQCETGIAYPGHVLSVTHSLMANADVALLKTYQAADVNACMQDCCNEKYGSCTIVSFKKNVTEKSCQHFNCRPLTKCRYLSSEMTDSFSFSSTPLSNVPSRHSSTTTSFFSSTTNATKTEQPAIKEQELGVTKESVATYSNEQFAVKNDNTTIKPRKGVEEYTETSTDSKKGIKSRKGVTLSSNITKSNIKPRKGVVMFVSPTTSVNELSPHSITFSKSDHSDVLVDKNITSSDLISALEKVFEDDLNVKEIKPTSSIVSHSGTVNTYTSSSSHFQSSTVLFSTQSTDERKYSSSYLQSSFSTKHYPQSSSVSSLSSPYLQSSFLTSNYPRTSAPTANLQMTTVQSSASVLHTFSSSSSPSIYEHSKLLFQEESVEDSQVIEEDTEESEKERKYKSSMHLVLSLVFGLLVLFLVLGVIAKRVYDGWMRRHYRRMDFLIDGMYNNYD